MDAAAACAFGTGRGAVQALQHGAVQVQRDVVDVAEFDAQLRAARQALRAQHREHQRQRVGAHQKAARRAFLEHRGGQFGDAVLLQVFQRPEALHAGLVAVVGAVGGVKVADDGEQVGVLRFERRGQRGSFAVARAGNDLPLVHQIDIAAQRRGGPGVAFDADAGVRLRARAHAHLHARRQRRLAAVDAGHAQLVQPVAPGAVGDDGRLGHDQVQRRAALARADLHLLGAGGLGAVVADQAEGVVRPVEVFRLAAHHLALGLEHLGQLVQKGELSAQVLQGLGGVFGLKGGVGQPVFGNDVVELVVAQVDADRHALEPRFGAGDGQRGLVDGHVQRHGRVGAARVQRVDLHHFGRQHGDLVARHVHRGQALAAELVERVARRNRQARRGNVDAQQHGAAAQAAHRQRVVDFGGVRVVDGKRLHLGQRQVARRLRRGQRRRKSRALGKVVEQKALPVELVAGTDGAGLLQQCQGRQVRGAAGVHHGLVFGRVLVRAKQNLVELLAHRLWALAAHQRLGPFANLRQHALLFFNGGQRLLHDLGRRLLEAALAGAAEIVRRLLQRQQGSGLLHQRGLLGKILARHVGKAEFAVAGKFPGQAGVDGSGLQLRLRQQFGRGGLVELEQDVGGFHLHPFARIELDLRRCVGFGQDAAGQEFSGIFKQCVHGRNSPMAARGAPAPPLACAPGWPLGGARTLAVRRPARASGALSGPAGPARRQPARSRMGRLPTEAGCTAANNPVPGPAHGRALQPMRGAPHPTPHRRLP